MEEAVMLYIFILFAILSLILVSIFMAYDIYITHEERREERDKEKLEEAIKKLKEET